MKALAILGLGLLALPLAGATQAPTGRVFVSPSGEPVHPSAAAPDPFEAWFSRVDSNHDGRIDRDELRADATQVFQRLDTNHDGAIDGFEVAAYEKGVAADLDINGQGFAGDPKARDAPMSLLADPEPVSGADANLNSKITLAEWLAVTDRRFDMLDAKHLGYLTRDALAARLPKGVRP
ncbi:MAG TPA: EF-hand domain-containing protein [Caulobacteraceae bacterium]|nr:EF-hand domain-containing protein [Caulobacteraceae bacterium]